VFLKRYPAQEDADSAIAGNVELIKKRLDPVDG
jgi:hypothetical protein